MKVIFPEMCCVLGRLLCVLSPRGIVCDAAQFMAPYWKGSEGGCWIGGLMKTSDVWDEHQW